MSFLDNYLKHSLPPLDEKHKEVLSNLEKSLDETIATKDAGLATIVTNRTFEEAIIQYSSELLDLIERLKKYIDSMDFSNWSGVFSSLRLIISASTEIYQITEAISSEFIHESMNAQESRNAKIKFGKDLVYFVWKIIDPLNSKFKWLPFKHIIEKKMVMWLAGMGIEAAIDFFAFEVKSYAYPKILIRKALSPTQR
jgi:hypothetical protein